LLILTSGFEFDWPMFVKDFFAIAEPVAEMSQQILSFDCFLDTRDPEAEVTMEEDSFMRIYY
jgi:hypothetical protein